MDIWDMKMRDMVNERYSGDERAATSRMITKSIRSGDLATEERMKRLKALGYVQ